MDNFEGESRYAEYSTFNVESDVNEYKLNVKGYSGDAGQLLLNKYMFIICVKNATI